MRFPLPSGHASGIIAAKPALFSAFRSPLSSPYFHAGGITQPFVPPLLIAKYHKKQ
jgi:hypothetical protein